MSDTAGVHILYVDNESYLAEVTAEMLERENDRFTVATATSASEGLEQLAANEFDCIVSNYRIPDQTGIGFLETVCEEYPDLPLIIYTGKGNEGVASDAISAGATYHVQKESGTDQYDLLANQIQNAVDQHREEEAVAGTEQRFQTIAEHTNDVLWQFSADWTELLFVTSAYEEIWGRSITELREHPQSFLEGVHPDDRATVKDAMEQLSAGESVDLEFRVNADEDFKRWVWVQGEPVFDNAGEVEKVVGFTRDITERKEDEWKLRLRRDRFRALFENLGEPVVEVIFEGDEPIIERMNVPFMDTFGIDEGAYGENLDDLIVPDDEDETSAQINERASDGAPVEREVQRGTDEIRPYLFRSAPFTGPNNRQRGHGIYIDITERKQREQALERQNDRLEKLASVISHDLRNPLQVANARVELAQREYDSAHLTDAADALERMETLLDDLLTIARDGQQVQNTDLITLAELVERSWENVQTANATLVCDTAQTIRADPSRLKQILENLVRNAIDHGNAGVTVTVGELGDRDGFYVADDGPGIPEDEREQVFDAGYSTTEDGTGLGLNIVQEIVEAHGWDIRVINSDDGGARFEITGVEVAAE